MSTRSSKRLKDKDEAAQPTSTAGGLGQGNDGSSSHSSRRTRKAVEEAHVYPPHAASASFISASSGFDSTYSEPAHPPVHETAALSSFEARLQALEVSRQAAQAEVAQQNVRIAEMAAEKDKLATLNAQLHRELEDARDKRSAVERNSMRRSKSASPEQQRTPTANRTSPEQQRTPATNKTSTPRKSKGIKKV